MAMSISANRKNKILAKIPEFTVSPGRNIACFLLAKQCRLLFVILHDLIRFYNFCQ